MSSMLRPMEQFVRTLLAARRVSTPLVSIRTADPALTVARIAEAVGKDAAIVQWDIVRGLVRVNDPGAKEIGKVLGERDPASVGPVDALVVRKGGGVVLKKDQCIGCKTCVANCILKAIFWDDEANKPMICVHCGICAKYCPHGVLVLEKKPAVINNAGK